VTLLKGKFCSNVILTGDIGPMGMKGAKGQGEIGLPGPPGPAGKNKCLYPGLDINFFAHQPLFLSY